MHCLLNIYMYNRNVRQHVRLAKIKNSFPQLSDIATLFLLNHTFCHDISSHIFLSPLLSVCIPPELSFLISRFGFSSIYMVQSRHSRIIEANTGNQEVKVTCDYKNECAISYAILSIFFERSVTYFSQ